MDRREFLFTMGAAFAFPRLSQAAAAPTFRRHLIAPFPRGYQVAVADVNGDGRLDVIALSTSANRVDWYENPTWKGHPVARTKSNIDLAPHDLNGDGLPEIALASGFHFMDSTRGGHIQWLSAPRDPQNLWTLHPIATDPVVHRLRWGDLDGDGRAELVHAPIFGPGSRGPAAPKPSHLWAFRPPKDLASGVWQVWKIDESLTVLHGIHISDLDGDGREEILTASFEGIHRFDFGDNGPHWKKTLISTGTPPRTSKPGASRGASEVGPGKLAGGRPFLASIEPWHGELVVVYAQREKGGPWQRHVIDDRLLQGHALVVADFDGDGQDEIVAGWRGGKGGVAYYDAQDATGSRWARKQLDSGIPVQGAVAADLNQDGRLDIVAIAGGTNQLVWYEQRA